MLSACATGVHPEWPCLLLYCCCYWCAPNLSLSLSLSLSWMTTAFQLITTKNNDFDDSWWIWWILMTTAFQLITTTRTTILMIADGFDGFWWRPPFNWLRERTTILMMIAYGFWWRPPSNWLRERTPNLMITDGFDGFWWRPPFNWLRERTPILKTTYGFLKRPPTISLWASTPVRKIFDDDCLRIDYELENQFRFLMSTAYDFIMRYNTDFNYIWFNRVQIEIEHRFKFLTKVSEKTDTWINLITLIDYSNALKFRELVNTANYYILGRR